MADAKRDNNRVPTLMATLDSDGATPIRLKVNTSNSNALQADDDTTGSDNGPTDADRDANRIVVAYAVSESDGTTPVAIYANSSGHILIDSN